MSILCPLKPRWERRKEARPQELLAAALDLFVERGFAATRLDDVAKAAGVSKGTLYLYFSSKEDLFKSVVEESVIPMIGAAEEMVSQFEGNTADLLKLVMYTWWERMGTSSLSGLPKLMMAEAGNFPEVSKYYQEEVIDRSNRMVAGILQRGIEHGEVAPVDLEIMARLLCAPMVMMMMWKHSCGVCTVEPEKLPQYLEHYIDLVLFGILKRPDVDPSVNPSVNPS
jgi:AcrR family transcriptional regulator